MLILNKESKDSYQRYYFVYKTAEKQFFILMTLWFIIKMTTEPYSFRNNMNKDPYERHKQNARKKSTE